MKYMTIESWASSLGYIVEQNSSGYVWFKENEFSPRSCSTIEELLESILKEIKNTYSGNL